MQKYLQSGWQKRVNIFHVALYKSPKIVEVKQFDNIIKKCKQEFLQNKDIATETVKCNWQLINTVKLSLKTVSVFQ